MGPPRRGIRGIRVHGLSICAMNKWWTTNVGEAPSTDWRLYYLAALQRFITREQRKKYQHLLRPKSEISRNIELWRQQEIRMENYKVASNERAYPCGSPVSSRPSFQSPMMRRKHLPRQRYSGAKGQWDNRAVGQRGCAPFMLS